MNHTALLLLGHGSRDSVAVQEFLEFARAYQNEASLNLILKTAFLELSEPSIPQALHELAEMGVTQIIAIPYFLFRASHVKTEIPEMLEQFRQTYPNIEIIYGNSLWPHKNLILLAQERINQYLHTLPQELQSQTDILIVGRGATDPEALSQFSEAVEELRAEVSCRNMHHCFIALAEPKYTEKLHQILENSAKHLVIFPFYLFTGILVKRIESQAKQAEIIFKDAQIKILPHFGSHPLMFQMLQDRLDEAFKNLSKDKASL
jgi:sirohydrochlorin cobaltochelatase